MRCRVQAVQPLEAGGPLIGRRLPSGLRPPEAAGSGDRKRTRATRAAAARQRGLSPGRCPSTAPTRPLVSSHSAASRPRSPHTSPPAPLPTALASSLSIRRCPAAVNASVAMLCCSVRDCVSRCHSRHRRWPPQPRCRAHEMSASCSGFSDSISTSCRPSLRCTRHPSIRSLPPPHRRLRPTRRPLQRPLPSSPPLMQPLPGSWETRAWTSLRTR